MEIVTTNDYEKLGQKLQSLLPRINTIYFGIIDKKLTVTDKAVKAVEMIGHRDLNMIRR